jgi:hypothetical protein
MNKSGIKAAMGITGQYRGILEYLMENEKSRPGFELIGMVYLDGMLTGYFTNPADITYVHVWEVKVSPDCRHVYSETWREKALYPIDGYKFRRDVILFKEQEELGKMGFYVPDPPNETLELDDLQWRCLWAVKENLKAHQKSAVSLLHRDSYTEDIAQEIFNAYMEALWDLQDILGDY